ncbi:PREDICTED: uncharacterized protein LOC104814032 [Tarenaya hassleriana]|uniref:uncharacterized protein LOC104814032 n=1 Tax=Tarenaya hassleriana TaxID=28532 RepID=UPI00053C5BB7|nr:PREDICTED: uncharacterized protein LOC104814032 [Tarenaya hassleriana]
MKLFHRLRKILMRLMHTLPSSSGRRSCRKKHGGSGVGGGGGERLEPPKMSCSSYYSSHSHYSEAIADCIEFFNKSSAHQSRDEDREEDHQVVHDHDCCYV